VRARLLARAAELGLRGSDDAVIEQLLEREVPEAEPGEAECRRYYEQNPRRFTAGELVEASHILFAMTPRVPPERLRAKAAEVHALATRAPPLIGSLLINRSQEVEHGYRRRSIPVVGRTHPVGTASPRARRRSRAATG